MPYGNADTTLSICNVVTRGAGATSDVTANASCVSDVRVRDLVGNVAEWVGGDRACKFNFGQRDKCIVRGGSFLNDYESANCDSYSMMEGSKTYEKVGFRCCSYLHP
jgi:formylglycine-generating enzyme required for sulfatase activity